MVCKAVDELPCPERAGIVRCPCVKGLIAQSVIFTRGIGAGLASDQLYDSTPRCFGRFDVFGMARISCPKTGSAESFHGRLCANMGRMSAICISHSQENITAALAVARWLKARGWSDCCRHIADARGRAAAIGAMADSELFIFIIAPAWLGSSDCLDEYTATKKRGKPLMGVIVEPVDLADLPEGMVAEGQICDLTPDDDSIPFAVEAMPGLPKSAVNFSRAGLIALPRGIHVTQAAANLKYHGFMSYSHSADAKLAPILQRAIQAINSTWFGLRSTWLFRDDTGFGPTDDLWGKLQEALDQSRFFILLASPAAEKSDWVKREVRYWLALERGLPIIILTEGTISWDAAGSDFDWASSTALPRLLSRKYASEPKSVDLRAVKAQNVSIRHPQIVLAAAGTYATLYGKELDQVAGEEITKRRKNIAIASAIVVTMLLTMLLVLYQFVQVRYAAIKSVRQEALQLASTPGRELLALDAGLRSIDAGVPPEWLPDELHEGLFAAVHATRKSLPIKAHELVITHLEFSPDGEMLVSTSFDGGARVWDAGNGRMIWEPVPADGQTIVWTARFSPHGKWLTVSDAGGHLALFDTATRQRKLLLDEEFPFLSISSLDFSVDGQRMATGGADGWLRLWSMPSGKLISRRRAYPSMLSLVKFSPDSQMIATASFDPTHEDEPSSGLRKDANKVKLWNGMTAAFEKELVHVSQVRALDFRIDRATLYLATVSDDRIVRLWNVEKGSHSESGRCSSIYMVKYVWPQRDAAGTRSRSDIVVGSTSGELYYGMEYYKSLGGHRGEIHDIAVGLDGESVLTASKDKSVGFWYINPAASYAKNFYIGHDAPVRRLAWHPGGRRFASADENGEIRIWSPGMNAPATVAEAIVDACTLLPAGRLSAAAAKFCPPNSGATTSGISRQGLFSGLGN